MKTSGSSVMAGGDNHVRTRRILVLNWRGPDHPQAGGAEIYLMELARRWSGAGAEVTLVTSACDCGLFTRETRVVDGVTIRAMGNRFTIYLLAALFILLRGRRYDQILDIANGIPFFAPLFTRTPVTLLVHHVHRLQWYLEFPRPLAALGWFLESKVVPFLYRRHQILTISPTTADELQQLGLDPQRIWLVYPGVEGPPNGFNAQPEDNRVLYVGRLKHYKRVHLLVLAVDLLRHEFPDIHLDIVGSGPEFEPLRELIARKGLEDHVTLHGHVDDSTKVALFSRAALFATASMVEGWGLSAVEASRHAVPVVAYDVPGLNYSVKDGVTGILVPDDDSEEAFAGAIGQLLRNHALRERLRRGGRSWAQRFSWEDAAERAMKVMEHQLENQPHRASGQPQSPRLKDSSPVSTALRRLNQLPDRLLVLGTFGGTSVVNYAFGLLMASLLLPGDFGLLAFAQTVLLLVGLILNSGFSWSLTAELPRSDQPARERLVRRMLFTNILLALALSAVLTLLFAVGPLRGGLERWSIALLTALTFPFLAVIAIGKGAMRGIETFGSMGAIQVVEVVTKLVAALLFVSLGYGPEGAIGGFLAGAALAAALSLVFIIRELGVSLSGSMAPLASLKTGSMFGALLGMSLLLNLDVLALKLFSGTERAIVGHYQAAIILANAPYFVTTALLAVLFPKLAAVGSLLRTGPRLAETLRLILLYLIPIEVAFALAPEFFLSLFFPEPYVAGASVLTILALGNAFLILAATFSTVFQATGNARVPSLILLLIVLVEVIGLRFLVPVWQATAAAGLFSFAGFLSFMLLARVYLRRLPAINSGAIWGWLGHYAVILGLSAGSGYAILNLTDHALFALLCYTLIYNCLLLLSGLLPIRTRTALVWSS